MGTYDSYQTDKEKEEEGAWVTLQDGSEWLLARGNSQRSQKARELAQKPFTAAIRQAERSGKPLASEIQEKINLDWAVNGIVLDWKNVTGPNGRKLPFSSDNVRKVLSDLPDLFLDIIVESGNLANYQVVEDEESAKNSKSGSSGN